MNQLREEYQALQQELADPAIATNPQELKRIGKRLAELQPLITLVEEYGRTERSLADAQTMERDEELRALAEEEIARSKQRLQELEQQFLELLKPKHPDDERSVILEVRAGTGGEEAALFAAELLRMYLRYAEEHGWTTELLSKTDADVGGVKEVIVKIEGEGAYGRLKYESGVHRVQRVPVTEARGRIHTSAATVAILPEAEEPDVEISPGDIKVDVFRSSGPGGQSVNRTDSAVRIHHLPTGLIVTCQDEKSQLKNKQRALKILRSRLYALGQERQARERGELRSSQIGTGDRSEKIRTYNFPQDRVTDHRLKRSFSNIPAILDGKLDSIIEALEERASQL
jgi:peptide chain release factor 1